MSMDADATAHRAGVSPDRPIRQVLPDGRIVGEIRSDTPVFVISVAAELAGMHAQTLRSYDREGLVSPGRTTGGGRRYSQRDISTLREVQRLSQDEGVNRAGIRRIIELESRVDALRERMAELLDELEALREQLSASTADPPRHDPAASRVDTGHAGSGVVVSVRRDVVPWRQTTTAIVTWRPGR